MSDAVLHPLWPQFDAFDLLITACDLLGQPLTETHIIFPRHDVFWYCSHPPAFFATVGHGVTGVSSAPGPGVLYQRGRQDDQWLPANLDDRTSPLVAYYKYDVPTGAVYINLDVMRTPRGPSMSSTAASEAKASVTSPRMRQADSQDVVQMFLSHTSSKDLATKVINYRDGGCTISPAHSATQQSHIIPKHNTKKGRWSSVAQQRAFGTFEDFDPRNVITVQGTAHQLIDQEQNYVFLPVGAAITLQDSDVPPPQVKHDHKRRHQPATGQIILQHVYAFAHAGEGTDMQEDYETHARAFPHNSRLVFANDLTAHGLMPSQKVLLYAYACCMVRLYGDPASRLVLAQDGPPNDSRRGQADDSELRDKTTGRSDKSSNNNDLENEYGATDRGGPEPGNQNIQQRAAAARKIIDAFRDVLNPSIILPDAEPFEARITRWRSDVIQDPDVTSNPLEEYRR